MKKFTTLSLAFLTAMIVGENTSFAGCRVNVRSRQVVVQRNVVVQRSISTVVVNRAFVTPVVTFQTTAFVATPLLVEAPVVSDLDEIS